MSHLADYIDNKNAWARVIGATVLNVKNLDGQAAQKLADSLYSDLSPENLTCDGELDRATVQHRLAQYRGALKELKQRFNIKEEAY